MKNLEKIREILRDREALIEVANLCDQAYTEGTGNPKWYTEFGDKNPEKVAQNMAGLQALISGLGIIAKMRGAQDPAGVDEMIPTILANIINNDINNDIKDEEKDILLRLANATWGAGQAFRTDKGPLGKLTNMNFFDLLDPNEVKRDWHQIHAAASWLYKKIM